MTNTYEKQALDFLEKTNTTLKVEYLRNDFYFPNDKEKRDTYKITLSRGSRSYSFDFGQSIVNSGFYYTKGKQVTHLDRSLLNLNQNNLISRIKTRDYSFLNNGKSDVIHKPKTPNAYDVLACLEKYDIGTFEDFCSNFGYDVDSRTAEKTYLAVCDQYKNLCALYSDDELELMAEIQ
jgi:hypothetical protein